MNQRGLLVVFLASTILFSGFVMAAPTAGELVQSLITGADDIFRPLFGALLGNDGPPGADTLFFKVFLFLAYLAIVWSVLRRVPLFSEDAPKWVGWVVAFAVAVLGVRFLTPDAVDAAALSSSATVLALFIFGSFAVFFYVIEFGVTSRLLRKLAWIILIGVYAGLWATLPSNPTANIIYSVATGLSALMFVFDGTFQKWRYRVEKERAMDYGKGEQYDRLLREKERKEEVYYDLLKRNQKARAAQVKTELENIEAAITALLR